MALQRSLTQLFRKSNIIPASGWRAFFAPFNSELAGATAETNVGPTILDLMGQGPITDSDLPLGWRDVGWLKDVTPTPGTKIGQVRSGFHGIVRAQYKGEITETIEFKFREITRMGLKIATGSDVFNLLDAPTVNLNGPVSASGGVAVPISSYDPLAVAGPTISLSVAASGALFAADDYIVCDVDYAGAATDYGFIGDNGTQVFQDSVTDTEYIRKTSDYVAKIASVNGGDLILAEKFVGGGSSNSIATTSVVPRAGSKVQKIKGFASREGGSTIMEWSAMFLLDTLDGAQFVWYYPHLSMMQFRGMPTWAIENIGSTDLAGYEMDCVMNALAFDDPIDGHPAVCYRAFYPRGRKQLIAI